MQDIKHKHLCITHCDLYIFGWCIYYLQGILYPEGSFISKSILILLLLVSLANFVHIVRHYFLSFYFKSLTVLIVMFSFYGILSIIKYGNEAISAKGNLFYMKDYLQYIYISMLPIFSFYRYTENGELTEKKLKIWVLFFFVVVSFGFLYNNKIGMVSDNVSRLGSVTNNISYYFVSLIPSLVLFKHRPGIQYLALLYCSFFILLGVKRGAMIIGLLAIILFIISTFKTDNGRSKFLAVLLATCVVLAITFLFVYMLSNNDFFVNRINQTMEGDSSGRDEVYSYFLKRYVNERKYGVLLFGGGANTTMFSFGKFAHNDWLEIAVNNGLLGIIIFIIYWLSFAHQWRSIKINDAKVAIGLLFVFYFTRTLFSMSYNDMPFYSTCILGYYLAQSDRAIM